MRSGWRRRRRPRRQGWVAAAAAGEEEAEAGWRRQCGWRSRRRKRWGWEPVEVRVRISSGEFGLPVLG